MNGDNSSNLENWKSKLNGIKISKTDMNKIILNFLCLEGYKDAAKKFEAECGLTSAPEEEYVINERKMIRELIQKDNIEEAISMINDLCPEVFFIH